MKGKEESQTPVLARPREEAEKYAWGLRGVCMCVSWFGRAIPSSNIDRNKSKQAKVPGLLGVNEA